MYLSYVEVMLQGMDLDITHLRASAGSIMQFLVNGSITPGK